jgi:hypothetical protein
MRQTMLTTHEVAQADEDVQAAAKDLAARIGVIPE